MKILVNEMMDKAMRSVAKDIAKNNLNGVVFDYLIEAQFIGFFNNYYINGTFNQKILRIVFFLVIFKYNFQI